MTLTAQGLKLIQRYLRLLLNVSFVGRPQLKNGNLWLNPEGTGGVFHHTGGKSSNEILPGVEDLQILTFDRIGRMVDCFRVRLPNFHR